MLLLLLLLSLSDDDVPMSVIKYCHEFSNLKISSAAMENWQECIISCCDWLTQQLANIPVGVVRVYICFSMYCPYDYCYSLWTVRGYWVHALRWYTGTRYTPTSPLVREPFNIIVRRPTTTLLSAAVERYAIAFYAHLVSRLFGSRLTVDDFGILVNYRCCFSSRSVIISTLRFRLFLNPVSFVNIGVTQIISVLFLTFLCADRRCRRHRPFWFQSKCPPRRPLCGLVRLFVRWRFTRTFCWCTAPPLYYLRHLSRNFYIRVFFSHFQRIRLRPSSAAFSWPHPKTLFLVFTNYNTNTDENVKTRQISTPCRLFVRST